MINDAIIAAVSGNNEMYKGKSRTDIESFAQYLGLVDDETTEEKAKAQVKNTAFCPVCFAEVYRSDACMYMTCKCKPEERHEDLYQMYKNTDNAINFCVDCGRICAGHRHFAIGLAQGPKPALMPSGDPFAKSCDSSDPYDIARGVKSNGGGSTAEKLKRVARFIDYAFELQHSDEPLTAKEAKDELIEEVWNAATMRMRFDPLKWKKWKTDLSVFSTNAPPPATEEVEAPEAVPGPGDFEAPIVKEGMDSLTLDDGIVIQFIHKNAEGVLFDHVKDGEPVLIGKDSLLEHLKTAPYERRGKCFDIDCNGWLWPQEIEAALADPRFETTDEERAIVASYKKRFNAIKAGQTGGAQKWKYNFFYDNEDMGCVTQPKTTAPMGGAKRKSRKFTRIGRKTYKKRRGATAR